MRQLTKLAILACVCVFPFGARGAGEPGPTPGKPSYRPPLRGAPAGRVGGGTRGVTERESFSLLVLAPDHVGFSVKDQPCLYWFISKPTTYPVELTLIEKNGVTPVLEKTLKAPDKGGIQSVCLADYGVRLNKNTRYKWFVTLVVDPEHRSKDIMAGGMIEWAETSASLAEKLKAADSSAATYAYAEEGFWYDALATISGQIESAPQNEDLRGQRVALLQEVGLGEAAEFEKRR